MICGPRQGQAGPRALDVNRETGKVLVEHVMMIKRHTRPNPAKQIKGGIAERESPIAVSNVMIVCPQCDKAVRIGASRGACCRRQDRGGRGSAASAGRRSTGSNEDFMAARLREHYHEDGGAGADQGVRLQERHGGAEAGEDLGQHRHGRSHAERQADGRRGERTGADRRPEAGDHQGDASRSRQFKLREGMSIGCMVTLRGDRMYEFFDRLVNVALPRVRDFRGVSTKCFDGRGNYTLGIKDQLIFPEIDYSKVDKTKGMNICITTTARTDAEGPGAAEADGHAVPAGKEKE